MSTEVDEEVSARKEAQEKLLQGIVHYPPPSAEPCDLRLLDYVDGFDKNLMCPICHCPFVGGTRLPCDHTFCRQCVTRALHSQQRDVKTCPSCRTPANISDLSPVPRFIVHMIDDLQVKCPEHLEGCPQVMRRGDVFIHIDGACDYREVECVDPECQLPVPRKRYKEGCLHEIVKCDVCQASMMKRDLKNHSESECAMRRWPCKHCHIEFVARDRKCHEEDCAEAMVGCLGQDVGCPVVSKRYKIASHEQSCPIAQMRPSLSVLLSRLDQQEVAMSSLRHRNTVLEKGLESLKDTLDAAKSKFPAQGDTGLPDPAGTDNAVVDAPFDSATHHLLSLHETLREEIERVSGSVNDLDARTSLAIMNDNLRSKEELAHFNAVVNSMRMQLQWLMSARLQSQQRSAPASGGASVARPNPEGERSVAPNAPPRRLSDSTKL